MVDVFISYSRDNKDFAGRLAAELRQNHKDIWIDTVGIRFTADWWDEIKRGIESSDNFLLIMSPSSLGSPVCHLEIEAARLLQKRVILINHEAVERSAALERMQKRLSDAQSNYVNSLIGDRNPNFIFDSNWHILDKFQQLSFVYDARKSEKFRRGESESPTEIAEREAEEASFLKQFASVQTALDTDMEHVYLHTRYGLRLREWESSKKSTSFLLNGDELKEAETWLRNYASDKAARAKEGENPKPPQPTEAQIAFIQQSRKDENRRRLLSFSLIGLTILAVITGIIVAAVSNQQIQAARDAENLAFANLATAAAGEGTALAEVNNANMTLTPISLTLTQASVIDEINIAFSQALLNGIDSSDIADLNALVEKYPNQADAYFVRGIVHNDIGDYQTAVDDFTRTIELAPNYANAYSNRGLAFMNLLNYEAALADFSTALELDENNATSYNNRGLVYVKLREYELAIEDFSRSLELAPDYLNAYRNRGQAYGFLGDFDAAIADFNEALEQDPAFADVYLERGLIYQWLEDYDAALADYTTVIELEPTMALAYFNRGNVYVQLGEQNQAIEDFSSAIALNPDFTDAYLNRGNAYLRLEDYEMALADYNLALELEPDLANAYVARGLAHYYLGNEAEALADINRGEELGFDLWPELEEIRDELEEDLEENSSSPGG